MFIPPSVAKRMPIWGARLASAVVVVIATVGGVALLFAGEWVGATVFLLVAAGYAFVGI